MGDDQAKILNPDLFKLALYWLECFSVDEDVIKVHAHYTLCNEVPEDVVHHGLKGGQAVGKTKEYDKWLEQFLVGLKGHLPLISFLNAHIIVKYCAS
ncbi:hypothetical protein C0989_002761 [Termitomyces sp. Mn162]|nr:hypothetical protein C0989_002761 [Termitomyces sp. Mn162]